MTVSVLMPIGHFDAHRRAALRFVLAWYEEHFPTWEFCPGNYYAHPWNKGIAFRDAYRKATGDVIVATDADVYTDPAALAQAAHVAASGEQWVVPYSLVYRLTETATVAVYDGKRPRRGDVTVSPYEGQHGGGLFVCHRDHWSTVGGMDIGFEGWGREDLAIGCALNALVGWRVRLDAPLWHLYHPNAGPNRRPPEANVELGQRYRRVRQSPQAMAALIEERRAGGYLSPVDFDRHRDTRRADIVG